MLNIVIPMSGLGSRFKDAGYIMPKPLIDINGKTMIQRVVDNLNFNGRYIFLALKDHCDQFNLKELLNGYCGDNPCEIVVVEKLTEGAACTALLAEHLIDNDDPLIIANSDQLVGFDPNKFLETMKSYNADGGILTFKNKNPKWSFAKLKENTNSVIEVAEKNPISDNATVGIYWYKHGKYFVNGAKQMIAKNKRVNSEFYICPVYNELILNGMQIYNYPVNEMIGLGTPEDFSIYLSK
jgi:dTDP-glucose pyrophosphorylase